MRIKKTIFKHREITSLGFLVLLFAIVGLMNPAFLSRESLSASINSAVIYTIVSVGMAFTIFTGEIDVSVGSTLGICAAVSGTMLRDGASVYAVLPVILLIGATVGFVNGWGVARMHIPSLIFTLGMNGILRGMMYVYTNGQWVENLPKWFKDFSSKTAFGGLSLYYVATIAVVVLVHLLLVHLRQGKYFKAVGDNYEGAVLVGIPARKVKWTAYVLCGICCAIAGLLFSSRIGFITPSSGLGYEMKAVAACVIGGISLSGGTGSVIGAAIGSIFMSSISFLLVFMGFSSNYDNAITGVILIAIVVADALLQKRSFIRNTHDRLLARTSVNEERQDG